MKVSDIMTRDPIVVDVSDSVAKAIDLLFTADVRHLPVVERGNLVGIISDRDVRSLTFPVSWNEQTLDESRARARESVGTVMSGGVLSVDPDSDVADVIDLMVEQRVGAIPVVDPHEAQVVGIVSYVDVLRALRDLL